MEAFVDHNGKTTFGPHVKSWSFNKLKEVFGKKHDVVKLAAHLGISVTAGEPVYTEKLEAEKPKKKKED